MYSSSSESNLESLDIIPLYTSYHVYHYLEHRLMVALDTELAPKCSINFGTVIRLHLLPIY